MRQTIGIVLLAAGTAWAADDSFKPYSAPCVERENVFEFTEKPKVKNLGNDKYEITFAVKGNCDVTAGLIDDKGTIVRHLASGVLGSNAPLPFQKNSLKQTIYWNGKDDLDDYVKEPGKLKVRVQLGLKPEFDKVLGWHPHDVPGSYRAIGVDKTGVYVLTCSVSCGRTQLRQYDHDGNYVKTVVPPPAGVPLERFKGMSSLEIEPGKKVLHMNIQEHATMIRPVQPSPFPSTVAGSGLYLPPGGPIDGQEPIIRNGWFLYANTGYPGGQTVHLYRIFIEDGSSAGEGFRWKRLAPERRPGEFFCKFTRSDIKSALSPDGNTLYLSGMSIGQQRTHAVYRMDLEKDAALSQEPFMGEEKNPGNDNTHFNEPCGVASDSEGRVYVCDKLNNRIQVFSPQGKFLKTIKVSRPYALHIHPKTGALYLFHDDTERGQTVRRLTKLANFDRPEPAAKLNLVAPKWGEALIAISALDPWTSTPRLWLMQPGNRLQIWEDRGSEFAIVRDFRAEIEKAGYMAGMMNARFTKLAADPVREQLYYYGGASSGGFDGIRYDLKTGAWQAFRFPVSDFGPDHTFDKRGYMYSHILGAVYRHDPARTKTVTAPGGSRYQQLVEVPFDYGEVGENFGGIALKDQPGARAFQDGIGVNMRGEVAVVSCIYYIPKHQEDGVSLLIRDRNADGRPAWENMSVYADMVRNMQDRMKKGEDVYSVTRWPGRILGGGTIWVYHSSGEQRIADLIPGANIINGVQIDEDGNVYIVFNMTKMAGGKSFLDGRSAVIGEPDLNPGQPFTGTLMKVSPKGAKVLSVDAPLKMEPAPSRPHDVSRTGYDFRQPGGWVEGAEWLYAGASPIVSLGCVCPNMRFWTDWNKRTFVPEAYRHSVGILDTNGNLLMHLGCYGNADSGRGPETRVKVGGDEIAFSHVHYVTGTENYLCVSDAGNERIVVLRLGYHAEETAGIGEQ